MSAPRAEQARSTGRGAAEVGSPPRTFARLLRDGVERHPDRVAVIDPTLGREVTFAGLADLVERAAGRLRRIGLVDGDVVALLARNGLEQAVAALACSRAGLVHLGLPVDDAAAHLGAVLQLARPRLLLVQPALRGRGEELHARAAGRTEELLDLGVRGTDLLVDGDGDGDGDGRDSHVLAACPDDADRTYALLCTSGSTGVPKLVRLTGTMTDTAARTYSTLLGLGPTDRTAVHLPMWWVSGHVTQLASALHTGGAVVTMATWSPSDLLRVVDRYGVTWLDLVPTLWHGLLRQPGFTGARLPTLRAAVFGGAPASPEVLAAVARRLPRLSLLDAYAMSEVPAPITCLTPSDASWHAGTVGRAQPHAEVRVLDVRGNDVRTGEQGAVAVRTPALTPGYVGPAGASGPLADPDGWFRTGDLGRMDEQGYLRITGRAADVLNRGGVTIHPGEVERALVASGLVDAALVVGVPAREHGDDVAALVVPRRCTTSGEVEAGEVEAGELRSGEVRPGEVQPGEAPVDVMGLRAAVRQRVGLHAVPVRLLTVAELPRNGNGKPDRAAARALLRRPGR